MAGYIGSKASVVSSGAERKKTFAITTTTTVLSGLSYTPTFVHLFHNGVRLVDGTDFTATDGTSITLTSAAESGDEVVVISYATFQAADAYTKAEADSAFVSVAGDTMTGGLTVGGPFTSLGIDDNAAATAMTLDASGNVGIGIATPEDKLSLQQPYAASGEMAISFNQSTYSNRATKIIHKIDASGNGGSLVFATNPNGGDATERMRIDAAGRVTMPYQPSFRAYNPVSGVSSVNTTIIWASTHHNTGNHYNTSTGVFTAPVAGIYAFTANVLIRYDAGSKYHRILYEINGVQSTLNGDSLENQSGPAYSSPSLSIFIQLSAGDTVSVLNGPTQVYGQSYGSFSGILIG